MARDFERSSSEYIDRADIITAAVDNFTMSAWINIESLPGATMNILSNGLSGGFGEGYQLQVTIAGKLRLDFAYVANALGATTLSTATLYHVLGVRRSGTAYVYLNGAQEGTTTTSTPFTPGGSSSTTIGARQNEGTSITGFFDGLIAEAAMWDRALSDAEIAALAKGFSPKFFPKNLLFYKPLIRDIADQKDSGTWTSSGTVAADHPRIYYPSRPQAIFPPAAAAASANFFTLLGAGT